MIKFAKSLVAVALTTYLSACGSSSDEQAPAAVEPVNQAPIINLEAVTGQEKQNIEVSANVSDDGTIASYQWSQLSGSEVSLTGTDSATVSFVAPAVDSPQNLVFALTATDDQGLSSRAEVTVEITQKLISLTIDGLATDSPIANADINVQVGEQTYNTNADASGQYSIELQIDDDLTEGMVQISAQGKQAQAVAHLSSIVGTFATLRAQAGDDNVLQSTENFAVNVTNLSSAKTALMSKANAGQAILTDGKITELATSIDANRLLEIATAIKVVIDKAASNPALALPEGIDNTLELLASDEALGDYITQVKNSPEFAEAAEEMLADSNITNAHIDEAVRAYYISACNLCFGEHFEMSASDNTGRFYAYDGSHVFTFSRTNNQITLDFSAADNTQISFPYEVVNGISQQVETHTKTNSISYTAVSSDNYGAIFSERVSGVTSYPNGEFDDIPFEYENQVHATAADSVQAFELSANGGVLSLPLPSNAFDDLEKGRISADNFTLNADGTGRAENIDMALTWQLGVRDGSAHGQTELNVTLADNRQLWYSQLNQGQSVQNFGVLVEIESEFYGTNGIGKVLDDNSSFDLTKIPGVYSLDFGFSDDIFDQFWWELWPTGEAYTFSTYDSNEDGQLSDDEVLVRYGEWSVNEQGRLTITRYLFADNRAEPGCFSLRDGCYLFHSRDWQLLAQDGELMYITNTHHFDYNADGELDFISFDNRQVRKADERPVPVALPASDDYPAQLPLALKGLVAADNYLNKPLYAVASDYYEGETAQDKVTELTFKSDNTYQWLIDQSDTEMGEYQVFADKSIAMVNTSVSVRDHSQFGFLLADDEITLAARQDETMVIFSDQTSAQAYAENIVARVPVASFTSLVGKQLVLIDYEEDIGADPTYFSVVDDTSIAFYSDSSYSQIAETAAIVTNQDGSITLDGNKLFISLDRGTFGEIVTDEGGDDSDNGRIDLHTNYFVDDVEVAERLVSNLNQLDIYHQ